MLRMFPMGFWSGWLVLWLEKGPRASLACVFHDADVYGPHFYKRGCLRCRIDAALAGEGK